MNDSAITPSCIVFFVHGTIPQICGIRLFEKVKWVLDGSPLRSAICGAIPESHCEVFNWSGENSHQKREEAGRELAGRIAALAEEFPCAPILIVAHSHGGNVALYATRELPDDVRRQITAIVTMGTPFIYFREHWSDSLKEGLLKGVWLGWLTWAIAAIILFIATRRIGVFQILFCTLVAALWWIFRWLKSVQRLDWDEAARSVIHQFQAEMPTHSKLLAVVTGVDEAGWWLRALMMPALLFDSLSFGSMRLFARIPLRPPRVHYRVYVNGAGILQGLIMNATANWIVEPIMRYAAWLIVCWAFSGVALALYSSGLVGRSLTRTASWGFGESRTFPWLVDVTTEILPVGARAAVRQSRALTFLDLRNPDVGYNAEVARFLPKRLCSPHSWLHEDRRVIAFLSDWCGAIVTQFRRLPVASVSSSPTLPPSSPLP